MNRLFFGDNLDVLRTMDSNCIDLIYLDPPFNSNADYNLLYGTKRGGPSQAQSHAFEDTWTWGIDAKRAMNETAERHIEAGALLEAFDQVFAGSNMMAYLAMMAVRLIELHRILKPTGSLYLHCDPTASHYLKMLLDGIFGPTRFSNEVIWKRSHSHNSANRYGPIHDTILFYTKSDSYIWNKVTVPLSDSYMLSHYKYEEHGRRYKRQDLTGPGVRYGETGGPWRGIDPTPKRRHWMKAPADLDKLDAEGLIYWPSKTGAWPYLKLFLDERDGQPVQDLWVDINPINPVAQERLGYPTQKPLALVERMISASSNAGDVVLDPFCGCGTAVEAAERLGRQWIGIDVTYLAIHVIEARLEKAFGPAIKKSYRVYGRPKDADDAKALAARDWLEFQKWAVMSLGGLPKDRPGADGGIDGVIRYHRVGTEKPNRAIVSVKGGHNVGVDAVHKLKSVMEREKAELGVLVCLERPTRAMLNEATSLGDVGTPSRRVPRLQIVPIANIFGPHPVEFPGLIDPPELGRTPVARQPKKSKKRIDGQMEMLLPLPATVGFSDQAQEPLTRSIRKHDVDVVPVSRVARTRR